MFKFSPCPLPPFSRVWLYLRDSGGDKQDLSSQRAYGLAYCQHYQLELIQKFEDSAISGGSTVGRDEFEAMIELARHSKKPLVDAIIYWDVKRFARNLNDSQFYKADLRRRGYRLISLSDNIPDNDISIVLETMLEWKAQKDREDLSKDIKRGMSHIVALRDEHGNYAGVFPGAPPTFFKGIPYETKMERNDGEIRTLQRLIPDPDTWLLGQRAWQMRAERASYMDIENALRLFPNNRYPVGTYYHIFRNEIYIGRLHYSGNVYDNFVPPLATPDQWEQVQALNYSRPQRKTSFPADKLHPKAGRGDFLLSGLCQCLYCKSNVHGSTNRRRERQTSWRYYVCATKEKRPEQCQESKRLTAQKIELAVVDLVMSRVLTFDFVGRLTERVNSILSNSETVQGELDRQQRRLADLQRAISNLVDQIEMMPSATLRERLQQRESERDTLKRQLEQLERQLTTNHLFIDESSILKILTEMQSTLENGEIKARQFVLQSAISRVELGRNSGRLHYRFPLTRVYLERVNWLDLNPVQILEFQY